jgi:ketosteroid isomerase-like protein
MNANEQLISRFYSAFQHCDYTNMNDCYSHDVLFSDPVFGMLEAAQVKKMWEMLCKNAKQLNIRFGNIQDIGDDYYTCDWTATYIYSKTGKKVVNNIKAYMRVSDGKIIEHSDGFSLYKWSRQAFGLPVWLFGWNGFFQRKIRNKAKASLAAYMEKYP